jgi:hypothetical protein
MTFDARLSESPPVEPPRCACGAELTRPESIREGRCLECRLCDWPGWRLSNEIDAALADEADA